VGGAGCDDQDVCGLWMQGHRDSGSEITAGASIRPTAGARRGEGILRRLRSSVHHDGAVEPDLARRSLERRVPAALPHRHVQRVRRGGADVAGAARGRKRHLAGSHSSDPPCTAPPRCRLSAQRHQEQHCGGIKRPSLVTLRIVRPLEACQVRSPLPAPATRTVRGRYAHSSGFAARATTLERNPHFKEQNASFS
jgi:hypothetical protein